MRAVITGATGMIGQALVRQLAAGGSEVLALVNPHSARASMLEELPGVTVIPCGLDELACFSEHQLNAAQLDALQSNTPDSGVDRTAPSFYSATDPCPWDAFFHLAWAGTFGDARDDAHLQEANIRHAIDAVECAKRLGCRVFVGAGSQAEYGRISGVLQPDTPTHPETGYGIAKLAAGQLTRLRCHQLGIRHVWMRILSVYGPGDGAQTMVMSTITALLKGDVPQLTPCEQIWDYLYCDDAARALILAAERGHDGAVYPLGSGKGHPLHTYVEAIRDAINPTLPLGIGARPYSANQVMHLQADINQLHTDTDFTPLISFETGIRRIIESLGTPPRT